MKNLFLILLICLTYSVSLFSQHANTIFSNSLTFKKGELDSNYKNLVGTIYVDDNFNTAFISLVEKNYLTRYDAYHDEMEIDEGGQQYYLPKTFDCTVVFNDKTYGVYTYNNENGFFNILFKGSKLSLLLKEKIKLHQEVEGNGIVPYEPPTLKRYKNELYVGFNNVAHKLPKNKKEFYKIFSTNSKEIQKYVSEKKLNIKKTADLILIFKYYNSL